MTVSAYHRPGGEGKLFGDVKRQKQKSLEYKGPQTECGESCFLPSSEHEAGHLGAVSP